VATGLRGTECACQRFRNAHQQSTWETAKNWCDIVGEVGDILLATEGLGAAEESAVWRKLDSARVHLAEALDDIRTLARGCGKGLKDHARGPNASDDWESQDIFRELSSFRLGQPTAELLNKFRRLVCIVNITYRNPFQGLFKSGASLSTQQKSRSTRASDEHKAPGVQHCGTLKPERCDRLARPGKRRKWKSVKKLKYGQCRMCGTTESPEWRRGPNGVKNLCNACGLKAKKMVKDGTPSSSIKWDFHSYTFQTPGELTK